MFTAVNRAKCIFCRIADGKEKNEIIYEDREVVVFEDHNPAVLFHLLAIPKAHIINKNELTFHHMELLDKLNLAGDIALNRILTARYASKKAIQLRGFHIPPHTSIDHLHMHIIQYDELDDYGRKRIFGPNEDWIVTYDEIRNKMKLDKKKALSDEEKAIYQKEQKASRKSSIPIKLPIVRKRLTNQPSKKMLRATMHHPDCY